MKSTNNDLGTLGGVIALCTGLKFAVGTDETFSIKQKSELFTRINGEFEGFAENFSRFAVRLLAELGKI
jgi:hypothetical protein